MKIGITERGDASLDLSWKRKLDLVDGVILITKKITPAFILEVNSAETPIIVHATCTGWGGSWLEPNVPNYIYQLGGICALIASGFPKENIVLRIDPIIPTAEGIQRAEEVIIKAKELGLLPNIRIRISILDEYPHVRERLKASGHEPFYGGRFQPDKALTNKVGKMLCKHDAIFETCAENNLFNGINVVHKGCVDKKDLKLMGLATSETSINPQGRAGCLCLSCKTELLSNKHRCAHGCLYCYWKD